MRDLGGPFRAVVAILCDWSGGPSTSDQWADRFNIPLKMLGEFVGNTEAFAAVPTGVVAKVAAKFLSRVPKVGPVITTVGPVITTVAFPALVALVEFSTSKIEEIHAQAIADKDYLTETLAQFRLDLDRGVKDRLLVKSPW